MRLCSLADINILFVCVRAIVVGCFENNKINGNIMAAIKPYHHGVLQRLGANRCGAYMRYFIWLDQFSAKLLFR